MLEAILDAARAGERPVEVAGDGPLAAELRERLGLGAARGEPRGRLGSEATPAELRERLGSHAAPDAARPRTVVETTGGLDALRRALERVDDLGTVVLAAPVEAQGALDLYADVHVRGLTVVAVEAAG